MKLKSRIVSQFLMGLFAIHASPKLEQRLTTITLTLQAGTEATIARHPQLFTMPSRSIFATVLNFDANIGQAQSLEQVANLLPRSNIRKVQVFHSYVA